MRVAGRCNFITDSIKMRCLTEIIQGIILMENSRVEERLALGLALYLDDMCKGLLHIIVSEALALEQRMQHTVTGVVGLNPQQPLRKKSRCDQYPCNETEDATSKEL